MPSTTKNNRIPPETRRRFGDQGGLRTVVISSIAPCLGRPTRGYDHELATRYTR
jgi:hypothetical protein